MTSVTSEATPTFVVGIQKAMPTIDWDNPKHVLLSLAAAVETHMGGTSGAVSGTIKAFTNHALLSAIATPYPFL